MCQCQAGGPTGTTNHVCRGTNNYLIICFSLCQEGVCVGEPRVPGNYLFICVSLCQDRVCVGSPGHADIYLFICVRLCQEPFCVRIPEMPAYN